MINKYLYLVLLAVVLFSCNSDDTSSGGNNSSNGDSNATSIEIYIDDDKFNIDDDKIVLSALNKLTISEDTKSRGLGLIFDSPSDESLGSFNLITIIGNKDWQKPPVNGVLTKTYDAYTKTPGNNTACLKEGEDDLCDGVQFVLTKYSTPDSKGGLDQAEYLFGTTDGASSGTLTITAVDTENLTVSGTFNNIVFRRGLYDEASVEFFPETITLKGKFNKVPYRL